MGFTLLADHRRFERLLQLVQVAVAADERDWAQRLWTKRETRLIAHLDIDDAFILSVFARFDVHEANVIHEEHMHIRARLADIGALRGEIDTWPSESRRCPSARTVCA